MKLAIIVANKDIADNLSSKLTENNFQFSSAQSYQSPLEKTSTTFHIPLEEKQIEKLKEILKKTAKLHDETISAPLTMGGEMDSMNTSQNTQEIKSGGATLMILPLDSIEVI